MTDATGSRRRWNGVRMRLAHAAADPDATPRCITLPADWDEQAAQALAVLVPGDGPAALADAANEWIDRLAALRGAEEGLGRRLALLLLLRRAAPGAAMWAGTADAAPVFVLNLAGFVKPGSGPRPARPACC